jgi:hypothetical protein
MKCPDSIQNSKLIHLPLFGIASQLINPFFFTSLWCGSVSGDFLGMKNNENWQLLFLIL